MAVSVSVPVKPLHAPFTVMVDVHGTYADVPVASLSDEQILALCDQLATDMLAIKAEANSHA